MYFRQDNQRLKTKIIATMGSEDRTLYDPQGQECDNAKYEQLFQWFKQPNHDCFMVDILRLNMAFYSSDRKQDPYKRIFGWLEQEKEGLAKNVGVLCDLAGAKTRLGEIEGGEVKVKGDFQLSLKDNKSGNQREASVLAYGKPLTDLVGYNRIISRLLERTKTKTPGLIISVGDGKTILKAYDEKDDILYCKVEKEGIIKSNWGITFEGLDLGLPSFLKADEEALKFILQLDNEKGFLSHIGVSFVRKAQDILNVRQFVEDYFIRRLGYKLEDARLCCPDIIAKIETKEGSKNIDQILDVADGAMIARGDLALQIGREEVPQKQKEIISLCNRRGKVVITATEMLASMEDNPKPTRAEVNDVFNAIMDGTDAVMLSGETSSGKYPSQAVDFMARIAEKAEKYYEKIYARKSPHNTQRIQNMRRDSEDLVNVTTKWLDKIQKDHQNSQRIWEAELYAEKLEKSKYQGTTDRICAAASELAEEEEFEAIVATTASGRTVRMLSRFRPSVKIIGVVYDEKFRRKMLLSYGAYPLNIGEIQPATGTACQNPEEVFKIAAKDCITEELSQKEDHVIFVSGTPLGKYGLGKVNILQIKEIL
jgi:pyruvate kinase